MERERLMLWVLSILIKSRVSRGSSGCSRYRRDTTLNIVVISEVWIICNGKDGDLWPVRVSVDCNNLNLRL